MHPARLFLTALAVVSMLAFVPQRAAAITLLRDADIEQSLAQIASPVLRAAGLSPNSVRILLIDDNSLNAFVADTQHIFIHSGLLMQLKSAAALQAVIAHEAAHISNGHLSRRAGNMRTARNAAGLGFILAAAAGVAGNGRAAAGIAMGTSSSALRVFLSHTRAEETSADQSSIRTLVRAGIDPSGALEVHQLFRGQEALSTGRQDPYLRTHPTSRERTRAVQAQINALKGATKRNAQSEYWFARTRAKLTAFKRAPKWTLRRASEGPTKDIAHMRRAVAYHRQSDLKRAVSEIDAAIALRPRDAALIELRGQILLEGRQTRAAVATYAKAAGLAPNNALILGGYGRALLASGQNRKALTVLEKSRSRDFRDARVLRDLAVAYSKAGQNGMASLVTAERYALQGRMKDAGLHAKRASGLLSRGSGPWRRAQDVLSAAKNARK